MQYRVNLPTMVLASKDNHQAAVTIQAGTNIEVIGPVESDDRFLVIRAGNEEFHIFASDLAARAERVVVREAVREFSEESPAPELNKMPLHKARARGGP